MAKKRKPKNLILPILTLSLLASLALATYFSRRSATPLRINEVSTITSNCSQVTFTDSFTGTALNSAKWSAYSESNGTVSISDQATLSIPANTTKDWGASNLYSEGKAELEGDFVHEVTLSSLAATPATSNATSFVLGLASPGWANWYRIEVYRNGDIQSINTTNSVTTTGTVTSGIYTGQPVKLKVARLGSTISTFYDLGSGYVAHSTFTNIHTGKLFIQLLAVSHAPDKPQVTAIIDDYSLKCLPPKPTNLDSICSPDGKKVTLRWDDVSPGKYHFGLNDPSENDNDWYKPGTTDVWRGGDLDQSTYESTVIPGRTYEWWVQSNEGGQFTTTSAAASDSFKCEPKPPAPTNLRHTCSPDGKSVRLMWDTVDSAPSYKVRVDDKAGKVNSIDGINGKSEYIVSITPSLTYSWWAHSTKDGFDSAETARLEFTCTPTTTPTPTPKPSIKPSVKPTVKPTATPAPSPAARATSSPKNLFDNTPSSAPAIADDLPTPTPTAAPQSSNILSRFFRWLASVFE